LVETTLLRDRIRCVRESRPACRSRTHSGAQEGQGQQLAYVLGTRQHASACPHACRLMGWKRELARVLLDPNLPPLHTDATAALLPAVRPVELGHGSAGGRHAAIRTPHAAPFQPGTSKIRGAGWNTVRCGQHVIKLHPKLLIQDRPQEATRPRPVAMCQPGRHSQGAGAGHGSFCTRQRHTRPGRWFRLAVIRGSPGGWRRLSPCRTVGSREPPRRRASRSRPPGDPRAGSGTTRAARPGGSFGGRHATPRPRAVSSPSGASLSVSRGADRGSASRHVGLGAATPCAWTL